MSDSEHSTASPLANQRFTATHWSVVLTCGVEDTVSSAAAMEELCRTYWYPLYAFVRRRGYSVEEAQDLTQEFFRRLIEKRWLEEADSNKGRFRSFLLTAMNHFLANDWRRSNTVKRGGGRKLISLDDTAEARYAREPASNLTPERIYERRWALSVFERALGRLGEGYEAADKSRQYEHLKKFLSAEARDGEYSRLGEELEMSPGAVASAVRRLRQHYRELVREEVAQTVESSAELETEIRSLLTALNGEA